MSFSLWTRVGFCRISYFYILYVYLSADLWYNENKVFTLKDIRFENSAITGLLSGAYKVVDTAKVAFGPRGRSVCIQPPYDVPRPTNQGCEAIKDLKLSDPFENAGSRIARQAVEKVSEKIGDGGTVTAVLLEAMLRQGYKRINAGANPQFMKKGIQAACDAAIEAADRLSREIETGDVFHVAESACDGDGELAGIVADVTARIGINGIIQVEDSQQSETTVESTSGIMFDKGYLSSAFINNPEERSVVLERPYVLLYEGDLIHFSDIRHLLEMCARKRTPLLILAKDVKGDALRGLVINSSRGVVKTAAVSSPGFGQKRERNFRSLSVLCECPVINEQMGIDLSKSGTEVCGQIEKAVIKKDRTVLQGFPGAGSEQAERLRRQYAQLMNDATEDYEREGFEDSLAYLSGGMALIKVGGVSEMEMFARKNKISSAVKAVRAAQRGGVLPGGGVAYLLLTPAVDALIERLDGDVKTGAEIVRSALEAPLRQIARNAGEDEQVLVNRVREDPSGDFGYDFVKRKYVHMYEAGIIDPAELVRTALSVAGGAASIALTVGACVIGEESRTMQTK